MALRDITEKMQVEQQAALGETAFFTRETAENTGETNKLFAAFFKQLAVEAGDRKEAMNELKKAVGKGDGGGGAKEKLKEKVEKKKDGLFAGFVLGNFLEQIGLSTLLANLPAIGLFVKQIGKATPTYMLGNLVFKTMIKTVKALRAPLNLFLKSHLALAKFGAKNLSKIFGGTKLFAGARISALAIELIVKDMFKVVFSKVKPINLSGIKGFGTFLKNIVLKPFEVVSDAVKVGLGTSRVVTGGGAFSPVAGVISKKIGPNQAKITRTLGTIIENVAIRFMLMKDAVTKFFKPLTSLFGGGKTESKGMMKVVGAIGSFLKGFGRMAGSILKFVPIIGWIFVAFDAIKGLFAGFAKYKDEGIVMGIIGAFYGGIEQVLVGAIGIPFDMITKAVSWLLSKIPGGKFLSDKIDGFLEGGGFTGLIRGFFGGLMDMIGNFFASFFSGFENGMISGIATMMIKVTKTVKKLYSFFPAIIAGSVSALANLFSNPKEAFMKTFKKVMTIGDGALDKAMVAVGGKTSQQASLDRATKKEKNRIDREKKEAAEEAAAKLEAQKKENARLAKLNEGASNSNAPVTIINAPDNSNRTTVGGSGGGGSSAPPSPNLNPRDLNNQITMFHIVSQSVGYA